MCYIVGMAVKNKTGFSIIFLYGLFAVISSLFAWFILKRIDKSVAMRFYNEKISNPDQQ